MALPFNPPITLSDIQNVWFANSLNGARINAGFGLPVSMQQFLGTDPGPPPDVCESFGGAPFFVLDSNAYFTDGSVVPGLTLGTFCQATADVGSTDGCPLGGTVRVIVISSTVVNGEVVGIGIKRCQ